MPTLTETYFEFAQRHGNDAILIGHRFYFSDGAMAEREGMMRWEPPEDPDELLRMKLKYAEAKYERFSKKFNDLKTKTANQCTYAVNSSSVYIPTEDTLRQLKELKDIALDAKKTRDELRKQVLETPLEQARVRNREYQQSRMEQIRRVRDSLDRITLDE